MEEQDKKAKLDRELEEARYQVEIEMETALREQEANRIREGNFCFSLFNVFIHFI